ncbi:hypothetical protein ACFQ6N_37720 [Kitasatospora sp. NPDC056446]|uniref:hypothetical protein n=1 Tax=Kitasatospora sp. NPDC056446 TaxID=3345819 RepID=UPI0036C321A3
MTAHLSSPDHGGDHPPVEQLADLSEGLVDSPDTVEALHRHLDGCAECRETLDAFAEVRALLGSVEAPPMPEDVAARLDAALAEAADPFPADPGNGPAAAGRPQEAPSAARRPGTPAPAVRAATGPSGPPSRPSARSGPATGPGRPRPRRRFALLLGAAAALAAVGLGGALLLHPDDRSGGTAVAAGAPSGSAAEQDARSAHTAGTDYRTDRLAAQIQQLLAGSESAPGLRATGQAKPESVLPAEGARPELSSPGSAAPTTSPASPAPTAAPSCPAPAPGVPLATDRGSYQGAPVDVLVYPVPGRTDLVDVFLRSPDCGRIVLHQSVPSR